MADASAVLFIHDSVLEQILVGPLTGYGREGLVQTSALYHTMAA